ncbi:MNIO family bufferin maturase [Amantichitinum ursilacus]|uniref:Uncharacterized protein n=1 Tax=Amantichitinum ursilacus TaxID=857265 RepID=A0A0N0XJ54_9NEIS|nr:DUF692 domain-containing protein [Amantichitinum ursilacus]KPC50412.1 hypothetical protein WG78_17430 [Amantichitinum ursilacus]
MHQSDLLTGLGLRSPHVADVLQTQPAVGWWEVHSENYFGGGAPIAALEQIRDQYPVSLHGVGLGLGSVDPLDKRHLAQLRELVQRIEPVRVSEHLAWNRHAGQFFPDLLPVPRLHGALDLLCQRIDQVQQALGRTILLENVSTYIEMRDAVCSEAELLAHIARRTGCGVLLDLNNLRVNALNLGLDPQDEMAALPRDVVGEIHVAGYEMVDGCAIDTHGAPVSAEVMALLRVALQRFGPQPVLLERDSNLPPLAALLGEYAAIQAVVAEAHREPQPC